MISINGLDKAAVLAALYNSSRPQGLGFLRATPGDMTRDEARQVIIDGDDHGHRDLYFDYVKGRVLKVDLGGDTFDPCLYDRDNGEGAAERVIETLR
jgi:hypothetical protein